MTVLTDRQRKVLQIIVEHWEQHSKAPTILEIGTALGHEKANTAKASASRYRKQLLYSGYLDERYAPTVKAGYVFEPCPTCGRDNIKGTLPGGNDGS